MNIERLTVRFAVAASAVVAGAVLSACGGQTVGGQPVAGEARAVTAEVSAASNPDPVPRVPAPKPEAVPQDALMRNMDNLADLFTSYWRQERGIDLDLDAVADTERRELVCDPQDPTSTVWYCGQGRIQQVGYYYDLLAERSRGLEYASTARGVLVGHEGGHGALYSVSKTLATDEFAENRADCISGAFMRWAIANGEITADAVRGGLDEGYGVLLQLHPGQEAMAKLAFQHGLRSGVDICLGDGNALTR